MPEGVPKVRLKIHTMCGQCGLRTSHTTRTRAYHSMRVHLTETGHENQLLSEPQNGAWIQFPHWLEETR
jgi:hypothetical protein